MRLEVLFALGPLVDLVGEDVFGQGEPDGVVEAGQQLGECLVLAADEHREEAHSSAAVATQPTGLTMPIVISPPWIN